MMRKQASRAHAMHKHTAHKKATVHHAAKTHPRRTSASKPHAVVAPNAADVNPDVEFSVRSVYSIVEDDSDDEAGIYGLSRGETAG